MAFSPSSDSPPPMSSLGTSPPPAVSPPPDSVTPDAPAPVVFSPPPEPPVTPPATPPPPSPSISPPAPVFSPPVTSPPPETSPPPSSSSPPISSPPPSSSPPPIPPPSSSPPPIQPPSSSPPPIPPPSSSPSPFPPPSSSSPPALPSPPPKNSSPPPRNSPPPIDTPSPPRNPPPPSPPINVPPSPPPPSHIPPISSPPPPKSSPTTPISPPAPPAPEFTPPPRSPHVPPPPLPAEDSPPAPSGVPSPPAPTSPPIVQIPPPSSHSPTNTGPSSPGVSKGGIESNVGIVIGVVSGIVVVLGIIGLIVFCCLKRKKKSPGNNGSGIQAPAGSSTGSETQFVTADRTTSNLVGDSNRGGGYGNSRPWFTYQELDEATGGFSDENLLGEGGFGRVYKGRLVDNKLVAVKQLTIGGGQGEREFQAEVEIISRIHHRHLVSLVGYCISESKRLLVYDFVPNNTLHFHLHGKDRPVMDWKTRVKIAVGAARGIAYLHEDCHPRVIHRDIKSANILIDNNYEAKVSDFGLAKLATEGDTHISTRVMGTFGYMAPEYARTGKLTDKSDVFSFGVVLLELITGRKPVDSSQSLGDESLVEWARPLLSHAIDKGEFDGLVDPGLEKNYIEIEMLLMIDAAAACVRHSSSKRPKMGQIVRALGEYDSRDLTNGLKVGDSQLYNSPQNSAEYKWFRRMAFGSHDSSSDAFTQSSGISTYSSRPNTYFSAQPVQSGPSSQESRNPLLSEQHEINVGISRQTDQTLYHSTDQGGHSRQLSREARNPSISGQSEINVNILDENRPDVHNSAYHSTNQGSDSV